MITIPELSDEPLTPKEAMVLATRKAEFFAAVRQRVGAIAEADQRRAAIAAREDYDSAEDKAKVLEAHDIEAARVQRVRRTEPTIDDIRAEIAAGQREAERLFPPDDESDGQSSGGRAQ